VVCGRDEIRSEDEKKLEASLPKVVIAQGKMLDAKRAAESSAPPHAHLSYLNQAVFGKYPTIPTPTNNVWI